MLFSSWLRNGKRFTPAARRAAPKERVVPRLELLEDRCLPSGYQQINLVGNQSGVGHFTDSNLNGWGMVGMPDGSFAVANAFTTGLATFYDRSGHVLPQTITMPDSPAGSAALGLPLTGHPTGVVYNPTQDFKITNPDTGARAPQ